MIIGIDTETHRLRRGYATPRLVCMSVATDTPLPLPGVRRTYDDGVLGYLLDRPTTAVVAPVLFSEPDTHIVAHNAAFDLRVLAAHVPGLLRTIMDAIDDGRVWDTRIRAKLLALSVGELRMRVAHDGKLRPAAFDLATLVGRYFGADIRASKQHDAWRLRYHELDGVPLESWPDSAVDYAIEDAVWTYRILRVQVTEAEELDRHAPAPIQETAGPASSPPRLCGEVREVQADLALQLAGSWGLRCDPDAVTRTIQDWTRRSLEGRQLGEQAGWIRRKGRDKGKPGTVNKAVLQARVTRAYTDAGRDVPMTAPSATYPHGQVRTAEEVLRESGDPDLEAYAESLSATGWLAKYAPILRAGTEGPVTYSPNSLVSTGRTSIKDPPMQQPPRSGGFRECFVPREGMLFAAADYATIELRALAQIHLWLDLGDTMARALRAGQDLHVLMAVDILRAEGHDTPSGEWSYDLAVRCLEGEHGPSWRKTVKEYRQLAKAANFGLPGGLGPARFAQYAHAAYGVVLDETRAAELRDIWYGRWPEMRGYFAWIQRQLGHRESFTARQFVSGRIRGGCGYTDGANTYFQGLVADGFKATSWRIARETYVDRGTALYGSRMVLPLHDEFVLEVPEDGAAEAAERLVEVMVSTMAEHIPDVPIVAEPALMRRWHKGAETVRDTEGRLAVWEPGV